MKNMKGRKIKLIAFGKSNMYTRSDSLDSSNSPQSHKLPRNKYLELYHNNFINEKSSGRKLN